MAPRLLALLAGAWVAAASGGLSAPPRANGANGANSSIGAGAAATPPSTSPSSTAPPGVLEVKVENLEGLLLLPASIRGTQARDTSGLLALDTGAGYLALDRGLASWAGIGSGDADSSSIGIAEGTLPRLDLGALRLDQVSPVLIVNAGIIRAVTDRPVIGLLGQRPLANFAIWIDPTRDWLRLIPAAATGDASGSDDETVRLQKSAAWLGRLLGPHARELAFELAGDGKILVQARIDAASTVTLVLDTGATKCVLTRSALGPGESRAREWRRARGLSGPTLIGASAADVAIVPQLSLGSAHDEPMVRDLDVAILESPLFDQLERSIGRHVDGLLGASFLWRHRVIIDYPDRVLWLDPIEGWKNPRPYEYCHIGLQLERREEGLRVVGMFENSPAALAGIRVGDDLAEIDGVAADPLELSIANRKLEGPPGTWCVVTMRRNGLLTRYYLKRERLL